MRLRMNPFRGIPLVMTLTVSSAFSMELPREVKELRDMAIAHSAAVCISAEKLKDNYNILKVRETIRTAEYEVADMPQKGTHATVAYRRNTGFDQAPPRKNRKEYDEWVKAQKSFPKPFPLSVVCVDNTVTKQTFCGFREGELSYYLEYFDEGTQAVLITFYAKHQMSMFVKYQNNARTGWKYAFDEKGNRTEAIDYGPAPAERCPMKAGGGVLRDLHDGLALADPRMVEEVGNPIENKGTPD